MVALLIPRLHEKAARVTKNFRLNDQQSRQFASDDVHRSRETCLTRSTQSEGRVPDDHCKALFMSKALKRWK
jgi:hypothetical protein